MLVSKASYLLAATVAGVAFAIDTETALWREDLTWVDLASSLSSDASLVDTSLSNYLEECSAKFNKPGLERSTQQVVFFCVYMDIMS